MDKVRILFPYVEAGFGHIMPMKSIEQVFRKKYGDKVEIISSQFFTETNNRSLIRYQEMLGRQVRGYNGNRLLGYFATIVCELLGTRLSSFGSMQLIAPRAYRAGLAHMKELAPDIVFSTHWVTNFYAEHQKIKPKTVMYCPDAQLNKLFEYKCDLGLISMPYGYLKALRKKQYNIHNYKLVPFLIRNEVFDIPTDKKLLRRELGLPEDKFTVVLAEGGYGIGRTEKICKAIAREHIPVTVIAMCGKNKKVYNRLKSIQTTDEVTLVPFEFTEKILQFEACSDLFCGKSGNIIAEATFFGVPSVITNFSTLIEQNIGDHYINTVGCAIREFSAKKTVAMIKDFIADGKKLEPYRKAALDYHHNFGAEKAADILWEKINEYFPDRVCKDNDLKEERETQK